MEKITINLLPEEFLSDIKRKSKKTFFLRISIVIVIISLIITSIVLVTRLAQSQNLQSIEKKLEVEKSKVTSQSDTEASVFVLKKRLDKINEISAKESVPVQAYNFITGIVPTGVTIIKFSMTKDNIIEFSAETGTTATLDQLFVSLLDPKTNQGAITSVKLENIRLQSDKVSVDMLINYKAVAVKNISKS